MLFHFSQRVFIVRKGRGFAAAGLLAAIALVSVSVQAAYSEIDVQPLPTEISDGDATGSGNGTLDFILFTHETALNQGADFNFDDANTQVATGGKDTYAESFVTSGADLKAYYDLNFGPGVIQEIVIFLDLNETTPSAADNVLQTMELILNPDSIPAVTTDPATGDVPSSQQNAINQNVAYQEDDRIASISGPEAIPQLAQGGGYADYAMFTGINPYELEDTDVIVFNQTISGLSNGGESKFLSGIYSGNDILPPTIVTIPSTLALLSIGIFLLSHHNRGGARLRHTRDAVV